MKQRYALRTIVTPNGSLDQIAEPLSFWGYLAFLFRRQFDLPQTPGLMGVFKRDADQPTGALRRSLGRFVRISGEIKPFSPKP
jgi:hypothetical protein